MYLVGSGYLVGTWWVVKSLGGGVGGKDKDVHPIGC